jgi:AmiR/NasT family two-component response regulator
MTAPRLIQNFSGNRALVVTGSPRTMVENLEPTLNKLGLSVEFLALNSGKADLSAFDVQPDREILFVDGDLASPLDIAPSSWATLPPAPVIGLVGMETPGRLKSLMTLGATAFLRKPVHSGVVYSALFLGINEFLRLRFLETRLEEHENRRRGRRFLIKAMMHLMAEENIDDDQAYEMLRLESMRARKTVEEYSEAFLSRRPHLPCELPATARGSRN